MQIPVEVKPAVWGALGGAAAAMIVGFVWGGWVTGGTSAKNAGVAANAAVVQAFVPLCVAKAELQPEQHAALKAQSSYSRYDTVIKAGWVSSVSEKYRRDVADQCGTAVVEAMDAAAAKKPQGT
jgi:dienelactone hydrolase